MGILIKNGKFVDYLLSDEKDIYIEDGIIQRIDKNLSYDCQVIEAKGLVVMPAFVDLHCHLRYPGQTHKEDLFTGTAAAAKGGYTTINVMANTNPICSDMDIACDVIHKTQEIALCDVFQSISVTKDFDGKTLSHLDCLEENEFVKFISEDGYGVKDSLTFYNAILKCKELNKNILIHAEDSSFSKVDMRVAEDLETIRDLYLISLAKAQAHFCHVSTQYSASAIINAKLDKVNVTFEVTPHHIALNDETEYRVNPPLQSEADRKFLIQAIKEGLVDAIATDHAPHTVVDKQNGSPGMVGLETAFSVCHSILVKEEGLSLNALSYLMSKSPSLLMGINKGEITEGYIGDVVLVDLEKEFTVDANSFASKSKNTPFHGKKYFGKVVATIKAGKVVYQDSDYEL